MDERNGENLGELFEGFYTAEQADKAAEDIWRAERILREHPAPQPSKELIAGIKNEIARTLLSRRRSIFRKVTYEAAAVAAAVIVLATIWIGPFEKGKGESKRTYASIIPAAIWESEDIAADDPYLASLTADVEQIESEVLTLQEGESSGNGNTAVTELETELLAINSSL
jgi:hypothetical protein